jgi:hypothetical protein
MMANRLASIIQAGMVAPQMEAAMTKVIGIPYRKPADRKGGITRLERKTDMCVAVLASQMIRNEAGDLMLDFVNQNRDSLDFTNLSRAQLKALIERAYDAGLQHGREYR